MTNILIVILLCLSFASYSDAAPPILHFSDITSGPKTGLTDATVTNKGAIVTIWGNNLGSTQGTSKVYVGAVEAAHVYYWGNANRVSGPADLYSYHQMQEISFAVPSTVTDGANAIKVTVGGVDSNTLPFTVRPGKIFFVAKNGSSANSGTWAAPKDTITNAASIMSPGDIVYVRAGSYTGFQIGGKIGTEANPFAVIAYPLERVTITPYTSNTKYVVSNNISTPSEFWHFSKLRAEAQYMGFGYLFKGERIIANEITNLPGFCAGEGINGVSGAISSGGGGQTADGIKMLGNYIHDYGCNPTTMPGHDTSSLQHIYYVSNRTGVSKAAYEIGWSLTKDGHAPQGLHNYDQGVCGGWTGEIKIHDNVVVNQRGAGINWDSVCNSDAPQAVTVKIYNNLLINTGLGPIAYDPNTGAAALTGNAIRVMGSLDRSTVYLYNNTIIGWSDAASGTYGINPSGLNFSSNAGETMLLKNNLMVSTNGRPFYDSTKVPVAHSNNLWYGTSSGPPPVWDTNPLSTDPKLSATYSPMAGSPALSAGAPIDYVTHDMRGLRRGSLPAIGALELTSAAPPPQAPNLLRGTVVSP